MAKASTKRANVLLGIGAALLIVGVAVAASMGRSEDKEQAVDTVGVVVARADLDPGDLGDDLVSAGKVRLEQVPADEVEPGAITATSDLAGAIVTKPVEKGGDLTTEDVAPSTLRSESITIPKGKQAVAITVDTTAGGGGYAGPGDKVDVYTVIQPDAPGAPTAPLTKLLLTRVEVLDVSNEIAPRRSSTTAAAATEDTTVAPRSTEGRITLLLALTPAQAEQAIFASSFNDIWVTVLPKDAPASATDGVTYDQGYVGADK